MGRPGETPAERRLRLKDSGGWIGVDFDGTLATYHGCKDGVQAGSPIEPMVRRVRAWREAGIEVRIFTARVGAVGNRGPEEVAVQRAFVQDWCLRYLGEALPVTNEKDFMMIELWDDRAVQVVLNDGRRADGLED